MAADIEPNFHVDETIKKHEAPENYLQNYIPQNGGIIEAADYYKPSKGVNPFEHPESLQKFKPFS